MGIFLFVLCFTLGGALFVFVLWLGSHGYFHVRSQGLTQTKKDRAVALFIWLVILLGLAILLMGAGVISLLLFS